MDWDLIKRSRLGSWTQFSKAEVVIVDVAEARVFLAGEAEVTHRGADG